MRFGAAWKDVAILNLSPRGAGLSCADPPPRGTYVEIRRGGLVIVARVAWSDGHRFGVHSQDPLAVDAIIAEPSAANSAPSASLAAPLERRAAPRSAASHDRSRRLARATEFVGIALLGGGAGVGLYQAVEQALARPLSQVSMALDNYR